MCLVSLATRSSKGVRFKGFRLIFILGGVTHMGLRMLVVSQSSTKQGVTQVEEHPVTRGGGFQSDNSLFPALESRPLIDKLVNGNAFSLWGGTKVVQECVKMGWKRLASPKFGWKRIYFIFGSFWACIFCAVSTPTGSSLVGG